MNCMLMAPKECEEGAQNVSILGYVGLDNHAHAV